MVRPGGTYGQEPVEPRGAPPVAVSAPVARLRCPEGAEQLGERLLHLIGRHRHPRLQQRLRRGCVDGALHALLKFLHDSLLHWDDVGEAEEAPGLLRRTVNFDGDLHDAVPVRGAPGDWGPRQRNGKVATWQAFPRPMLAATLANTHQRGPPPKERP